MLLQRWNQVATLTAPLLLLPLLSGQTLPPFDSDSDGLNDALESALLQQFRPTLMISKDDCSVRPAQLLSGAAAPTVVADDGMLYGQASPRAAVEQRLPPRIELHFYHLWRRDCGRLGHPLDAEHVAVLLEARPGADRTKASAWHAAYWYAAAHEDTVCDSSQISRAATLHATTQGATVWVSSGKHASYLNEELCHHGCGGDRCVESSRLAPAAVINLGEAGHPCAGAVWASSKQWPLLQKLTRSDFSPTRVARLQRLPEDDIAWANPAKRPAQAVILGGNATLDGTERGGATTRDALAASSQSTDAAMTVAGGNTGSALRTAARSTGRALQRAAHTVRHSIGVPTSDNPDGGVRAPPH